MQRVLLPTTGPTDWRRLLADPAKHWRPRKSAYELAMAWEAARHTDRGLPSDVAALLDTDSELQGSTLLLGIPEHRVALTGGGHASQTDLWGILRTSHGLVSMAVEGKAGEGFDKPVTEWLSDAKPTSGKPARLQQLCGLLGISDEQAHRCRYQLLHRTAAAILEAKRWGIGGAVLLVQSFVPDQASLADYKCFGEQLGIEAHENAIVKASDRDGIQLWLGWVTSPVASDQVVRSALT